MNSPDLMQILIVAIAGSLGWGIRGVFGGPVGAMIPGAFMGGAAGLWLSESPDTTTGFWFMAVVGAAAFYPGGGMTYGQTLGLIHNPDRAQTYWWGVLGCFIKGGLWFGTGTVLLGLAAHGALQNTGLVATMAMVSILAGYIGKRLLNYPMDPPNKYPVIYFSRRAKENLELSWPRQESWGGMLFGLLALIIYGWLVLDVSAAWQLAGSGFIAGGIGFAMGEIIQAGGIWRKPLGAKLQPWIDWWKVMEMTFGAIGGAGIGLALMLYGPDEAVAAAPVSQLQTSLGIILLIIWLSLVIADKLDLRTAEKICNIPMLGGVLLITAASAAPSIVAPVIVCGFLVYSSGLSNIRRWQGGISRNYTILWHIILFAVALLMCLISTWPTVNIFLLIVLVQCLMAFVRALGEGSGTLSHRIRNLGSALPVNAGFLILFALLWALIV